MVHHNQLEFRNDIWNHRYGAVVEEIDFTAVMEFELGSGLALLTFKPSDSTKAWCFCGGGSTGSSDWKKVGGRGMVHNIVQPATTHVKCPANTCIDRDNGIVNGQPAALILYNKSSQNKLYRPVW